jgi:DNA polymerase I-like protein with 3'-5' exonuclease and polymerase domains
MRLKLPTRIFPPPSIFGGEIPVVDGWVAFDTETTGLDPWGRRGVDRILAPARAFMVSVCNADGDTTFARWAVNKTNRVVDCWQGLVWLPQILADKKIVKVMFNATYDLRMLEKAGFVVKGEVIDAMLMAHTVWPEEYTHELKPLTKKFCAIEDDDKDALMETVQKARAAVHAARKRIETEKTKSGDAELAATAIYEPPPDPYSDKKQTDKWAAKADMWLGDLSMVEEYARRDALRTATLKELCVQALDDNEQNGGKLWTLFRMEQQLQLVIKKMEDKGVALDWLRVDELGTFYHDLMEEHRKAADHIVPKENFDIESTQDIQEQCFIVEKLDHLNYCFNKVTKQPTPCPFCKKRPTTPCLICRGKRMNPQVDGEFFAHHGVMHGLDEDRMISKNAFCWHVLHYKAARAMLSFVKSYKKFGEKQPGGYYVLHPNYKQVGPETGRMACERPNLQNVADGDSGKKRCTVPYLIRDCFVPRPGYVFLSPDYSQIEIWLLFLRSGDTALGSILLSGGDTHGKVALAVVPGSFDLEQATKDKKVDPSTLSSGRLQNLKSYIETRKRAKNTQFCKVYGGGPGKIAKTARCTLEEATKFYNMYAETFSGVTKFMRMKTNEAKYTGKTKNFYGREYMINPNRAYVATNYDIQGSAADLIKRAMIRVAEVCTQKASNLLLQVHDELLLESPKDRYEETMLPVAQAMQADWKLWKCPVPFPVGMKVCERKWSEGREVKL